MTLQTRKPTGRPAWPLLTLAGREGAGKTWAAISASASKLVGRTIYIGFGEDDPDEYSLIPGADFEIAIHDGTYPGVLATVRDAVAAPTVGDLPTLLVFDSATRLWNLIGDNMQAIANRRAKGRKTASGDYAISPDLWNVAAMQWQDVMDALREHRGPVIMTARLDSVTVMEDGQPTKEKEWKVQAHKSLVFDSTAIVEMRERGQYLLTKVKSVRHQLDKPLAVKGFTVDGFWGKLGLADGTTERSHATVRADRSGAEPAGPQGAPQQGGERPAPPHQGTIVVAKEWLDRAARTTYLGSKTQDDGGLRTLHRAAARAAVLTVRVDADDETTYGDFLMKIASTLPEEDPAAAEPDAPAADPASGEVDDEGPAVLSSEADAAAEQGEPVTDWATAQIPNGGES